MFSALAGFVEPGESLEEAVRREIREEAGIEVGGVRYHAAQPWPFPHSLMLGCIAEGLSDEISLNDHELGAARWFTRDELRAALAGRGEFAVPGPLAIAHHLIRAFVES
jgi:NAD+ diphosphatase